MRIIHIAPNAPYNEGWSYQENLLPKYQAKLGHEVVVIVTNLSHQNGELIEVDCNDYLSPDGFRVIRRRQKFSVIPKLKGVLNRIEVYDLLIELNPDYIFYHGMISMSIFQVTRYKRLVKPTCIVVQDNHLDYNIGFNPSKNLKALIMSFIYRTIYRMNDPYISKVYGVTPWRVNYAIRVFGVPEKKTDLLIMGADDEFVRLDNKEELRNSIRNEYRIKDDEILLVTGAKIDERKKIHLLMEAVNELRGFRLLVFGSLEKSIEDEFKAQLSNQVEWVGWVNSTRAYEFFLSADLVVFPGQHSVFWEQACACKVPCLFASWEGMRHLDVGGNASFLNPVTKKTIKEALINLTSERSLHHMKAKAESQATDLFLYSKIAKKTIDDVRDLMQKMEKEGKIKNAEGR